MNFNNLASFAEHLALTQLRVHEIGERLLTKACLIIERDAKKRIGKYQDAIGPFQDWAELAESTQEQRERAGYTPNDPLLRSGELRDSIQHEVKGEEAVVGSTSEIAAYQEFGTRSIPPRPFLGPAAFASKEKVENLIGHGLMRGLFGGEPIHESLGYDHDLGE